MNAWVSESSIEQKNPISVCADNMVTTGPCKVEVAGKVVSDNFGSNLTSWNNAGGTTNVTANIPNGFYANHNVIFTDTNLIAANIINGVSIFGVTGTATTGGAYSPCSDDALNAGQCSTAVNRYVTATSGNDITSWTNGTGTTTVSANIPNGYYNGKTVQFTDADLVITNIKNGVNIFGVTGSLVEAYAACTDDALNAGQCSTAAGRYVTATAGSDITSWINGTGSTTVSSNIPNGYYTGKVVNLTDADLIASNIKNGVNIFDVIGTALLGFSNNAASSAYRDPGSVPAANHLDNQNTSLQITLNHETTTYAGANLPTTAGYNYRDIPNQIKDDEGYLGTSCKYAPRPTSDCGTSQATIALRIADCAAANPATSTWNGATQCNGGEGTWNLVSRDGANKEVWQDARTGLIWSSVVASANWCRASGNTQQAPVSFYRSYNTSATTAITGNGTIGAISGGSSSVGETITITFTSATTYTVSGANCGGGTKSNTLSTTPGSTETFGRANYCSFTITQGAVNFVNGDIFQLNSVAASSYSCDPVANNLQPTTPISYCTEGAGFNQTNAGENWGSGTYMAAKGRLGRNATPSVAWRLPTINDYKQADVNGVRFVMPDMGIAGNTRPNRDGSTGVVNAEWSSSVSSFNRIYSWSFYPDFGYVYFFNRVNTYAVRCVGR